MAKMSMKTIAFVANLLLLTSTNMQADAFSSSPLLSRSTGTTTSTTILHYATTVDPQLENFQKRMRNLVQKRKPVRKLAQGPHTASSSIEKAMTLGDYKSMVADEKDKMVVVRFYAPWCRACKAATPAFMRLTSEFQSDDKIKFVDCPVTEENVLLHKELGIKTIPFAHVYHPEAGLVEERKIGRKHFSKFEKVVNSYVQGQCELLDDNCSDPYPSQEAK